MGSPSIGSVVLINFPFADLKSYKKRPAVVVAYSSLDTVILCQITSRKLPNAPSITITEKDFIKGNLPVVSYIRPDKLFTIDAKLADQNKLGSIADDKVKVTKEVIRTLFA